MEWSTRCAALAGSAALRQQCRRKRPRNRPPALRPLGNRHAWRAAQRRRSLTSRWRCLQRRAERVLPGCLGG
jgi:hypothetical protein